MVAVYIYIYIYIIHLHRSIDAQLCTVYVFNHLLLLPHLITLPYFHNERYAIFGADSAGLNWLIRENEAFDRWQRRKCDVRPDLRWEADGNGQQKMMILQEG